MEKARISWSQTLSRMRGENIAFELEPFREVARQVKARAGSLESARDEALAEELRSLRPQAEAAAEQPEEEGRDPFDVLLVPVFALVYEAARRRLGLVPYEEQLVAAVVMAAGKVAEMQTGEGKTLSAVFAATLRALSGRGVHVLTTNDYLARRDAAWMGPVYEALGVEVRLLQQGMDRPERQHAYGADVTYGTLSEVGFDLLRDGLLYRAGHIVQRRGLYAALLDDLDCTLVDEARHPLVVAGEDGTDEGDFAEVDALVRDLEAGEDYAVDEHGDRSFLTEEGADKAEERLGRGDLFTEENLELLTRLNLAVHAHAALQRDVDYIVRQGRIELIDEHRGRVAEGRRLPDGVQAALEQKEGLARTAASRVLARTTLQAVARLYPKLAGMTATAHTVAEELGALYRLEVVVIPPHRRCVREDYIDLVFTHGEARDEAVLAEIEDAHGAGRPVLVGTRSVDESEQLAATLREGGVASKVLNARNDELEAEIISEAGAPGAVTISTNMAGRGTDIRLGGADESERDRVVEAGGLCVIGTRRAEGERVDDQLRGRAGRQGDPGSSQLFVSLEDDLFTRYGVRELLPARFREARSEEPLLEPKVIKEVDRAQRIIAARNSSIRKTLWGYEAFVEGQRRAVWRHRRLVLLGRSESALAEAAPERYAEVRGALGEGRTSMVEALITLAWIDRAWADHLARLTDIREQVQLMLSGVAIAAKFGRESPQTTFRKRARESYEAYEEDVAGGIVETFDRVDLDRGGVDLSAEGLKPPGRTWTYVITEQPLDTKPPPRLPVTLAKRLVDMFKGKK